jgi:hypothetical protein
MLLEVVWPLLPLARLFSLGSEEEEETEEEEEEEEWGPTEMARKVYLEKGNSDSTAASAPCGSKRDHFKRPKQLPVFSNKLSAAGHEMRDFEQQVRVAAESLCTPECGC